ncbi:MAG: DnaJ domain-containing protein [Polyangiaceae bacterium]
MEFVESGGASYTLSFVEGQPAKCRIAGAAKASSHLIEAIEKLYGLPAETAFAYYDQYDALADDKTASTPIDPLPIVWQAIVRDPPWQHVHDSLQKIGPAAVRLHPEADLTRFGFGRNERAAAERLRKGAMSVYDLTNEEILIPGRTQLLVYCLLLTKFAVIAPAGAAPPPPRSMPPAEESPPDSVPDAPSSSARNVARVRLKQTTTSSGISTFEEHPVTLSSSDSRQSSPPGPVAPVAAPGPPTPPKALPPELEKRRQTIIERAKTVEHEDYFTMLAVARDATTEQVRAAFFVLAKLWHPDRLPPVLADSKVACAQVFARMSEAHQTLTDPERRTQYMRLIAEGGASPNEQDAIAQVLDAATNFQKAEVFLRRGDVTQAATHCDIALKLDPLQADYLALSVWLEAMKPANQSPDTTLGQIALLSKAIVMNEKCERALFYRGMLYKRLDKNESAMADFKRSSELNPRNVDSQREVRLYNMRSGKDSPKPGKTEPKPKPGKSPEAKGFFGNLFKKK